MNYEALGKYTHLKTQREVVLDKLHVMSRSVGELSSVLDHYRPPYPGTDLVPERLARLAAVLPEIKTGVQQIHEMWAEMERLRTEFNLP